MVFNVISAENGLKLKLLRNILRIGLTYTILARIAVIPTNVAGDGREYDGMMWSGKER